LKNGIAVDPDGIPVEVWKVLKGYGWVWWNLLHEETTLDEKRIDGLCEGLENKSSEHGDDE
jgi:hypothetical protein